jgi:uncharacterized membrane protein
MASSTTTRKPEIGTRQPSNERHEQGANVARMTFAFAGAVVTAGLVAGLFFFNASVVMPALADLDDRTFVEVMDRINDAVYNPLFFAVLFGAPVLIAVAAVQQRRGENPAAARWAWAALALYLAGVMLTSTVNVPLTDDLVAAQPRTPAEFAAVREDFEGPFNAADIVRTILHTAAVACLAAVPVARSGLRGRSRGALA